jgi:hypothetical protein
MLTRRLASRMGLLGEKRTPCRAGQCSSEEAELGHCAAGLSKRPNCAKQCSTLPLSRTCDFQLHQRRQLSATCESKSRKAQEQDVETSNRSYAFNLEERPGRQRKGLEQYFGAVNHHGSYHILRLCLCRRVDVRMGVLSRCSCATSRILGPATSQHAPGYGTEDRYTGWLHGALRDTVQDPRPVEFYEQHHNDRLPTPVAIPRTKLSLLSQSFHYDIANTFVP